MKTLTLTLTIATILLSISAPLFPQSRITLDIRHRADIPSTCFEITMTMQHDRLDRPYLYVASKEGGLKIYNISNIESPLLVKMIPIDSMQGLDVMNLEQSGNHLFLALGNHFTNSRSPGMAIVDVSRPESAFVTDAWKYDAPDGGGGIVKVDGDYAYLGAMKHGMIILDVSDVANIAYVSRFVPDINYPTPNPNPDLYNARGMVVRNDVVYLCYDAGGLRIINVSDKRNPVETGHYSNPLLNGLPRAYNNIVLDDSLAYITFDYCGLEVLNVSDTSHITQVGWWNPYNCPDNNWFASPVHANEIDYNRECKLLFLSTGKSDLYVLDVTNPSAPDSVGNYGGIDNNIGTWGVSTYRDMIFLSYICAIIPFGSNWTGVKILSYDNTCLSDVDIPVDRTVKHVPVMVGDRMTIRMSGDESGYDATDVIVTNAPGQTFLPPVIEASKSKIILDTSTLTDGAYILSFRIGSSLHTAKFIRNHSAH